MLLFGHAKTFTSQIDLDQYFGSYHLSVAKNLDDLTHVLRLRHQVFFHSAEESNELDIDPFDMDAEHLMLWDLESDRLVGTYRMRSSEKVQDYYSQGEFDLSSILALEGIKVELGRACLHPDFRNGSTMGVLWQGLAEALRQMKAKWVFGCSSIPVGDGSTLVNLCSSVYQKYLSPEKYRVRPWKTLEELKNLSELKLNEPRLKLPPLLKAYLNLGAWVCGEPAWDPEFDTVDFLTLLDVESLDRSVARHFSRIKEAQ